MKKEEEDKKKKEEEEAKMFESLNPNKNILEGIFVISCINLTIFREFTNIRL